MQRVNDFVLIHMEIEGVVGVRRVEWVAVLRLFPADDFTNVFIDGFAFCKVLQRKYTLAVDARSANLYSTTRRSGLRRGLRLGCRL